MSKKHKKRQKYDKKTLKKNDEKGITNTLNKHINMSRKLRAQAASKIGVSLGLFAGQPPGARTNGTKRAKKAPQKCAKQHQKVATKTSKKYRKAAQMRPTIFTKQISKKCTFPRYFAIFLTRFKGRFRRFFGLFCTCGAARLGQRPPRFPS